MIKSSVDTEAQRLPGKERGDKRGWGVDREGLGRGWCWDSEDKREWVVFAQAVITDESTRLQYASQFHR